MQVNTKIQNPTNFFFNDTQKQNECEEFASKIAEFTKKLLNTETCALCKQKYNFTNQLPRILIHCGHTFCTQCLRNFHKNGRVRCPMCLKLVKHIDSIDRLPVNHTIFTKLAQEYNTTCASVGGETIDSQAALYSWFEASSKKGQHQSQQQAADMQEGYQGNGQYGEDPTQGTKNGGPRIDPESNLEWCEYHYERVKHFLCMTHRETGCRVCCELFHNMPDCNIIELYDIEDMHGFLHEFFKKNANGAQNQQQLINGTNTATNNLQDYAPSDFMESSLKGIPSSFPQSDHVNYTTFNGLADGGVNVPHIVPDYSYKEDDDEDEDFEDDDDDEDFEDQDDDEE